MDAVTAVLLDRSRVSQDFSRMVLLSLVLHGVLLTALVVLPHEFARAPAPVNVMTITLGGAAGPIQGRLQESAKAVQVAAPETTKPKQDTPPALNKPEMVEPVKNATPLPKATAKPE